MTQSRPPSPAPRWERVLIHAVRLENKGVSATRVVSASQKLVCLRLLTSVARNKSGTKQLHELSSTQMLKRGNPQLGILTTVEAVAR
jgi:hypothetical protein